MMKYNISEWKYPEREKKLGLFNLNATVYFKILVMMIVLLRKSGALKLNRLGPLWIFNDIYIYLLAEYVCTTFHSYEHSRGITGMGQLDAFLTLT